MNYLKSSERHLTWLHLAFLFFVTLLPFSTGLLPSHIWIQTALLVYWANILLLGVTLYVCWGRATPANLVKDELNEEMKASVCRRIIIAQSLYAGGAALCFINNYLCVSVILLIQLIYALAPRSWIGNSEPKNE